MRPQKRLDRRLEEVAPWFRRSRALGGGRGGVCVWEGRGHVGRGDPPLQGVQPFKHPTGKMP